MIADYNRACKRKGDAEMNMIETHNLTKAYGDFKAVSKLNLHVKKGTVYGFLGPNGAGKIGRAHV